MHTTHNGKNVNAAHQWNIGPSMEDAEWDSPRKP